MKPIKTKIVTASTPGALEMITNQTTEQLAKDAHQVLEIKYQAIATTNQPLIFSNMIVYH